MAGAGRVLLVLCLLSSVYGLGASLHGARSGQGEWVDSGRRAMYSVLGMSAIAFVILDSAFISSDFSYKIVASGSSTTTPFFYRAAAIWSTQQGSLLLWVMLLSFWSSLALLITRRRVREIVPYAQSVLFGMAIFFVGLIVFFANPFATLPGPPTEGAGLDPLLRHTTMMIHPPMLYSGFTLLLVPFAFCIGALVSGRVGAEWIQVTRRFALAGWLCLGIGLLLGARWSYTELGWGGYWEWDPVENAALMPWLVCTAYIHSIMIQEKRGMLKVWNTSLVLLTGTLAIVGDFLVRSGILSSIHAFVSDPTLNVAFVVLIAAMVLGSVWLVTYRRDALSSEHRLDSLLSREGVFLIQNVVLVALAAVVFWLTFFPLISEAITGTQTSVGPPVFAHFVVPLALIVVVLSGIGPIIAWRRVTVAKLKRTFAFPVAVGLGTFVILAFVSGVTQHVFAYIMFGFGAFVVATVAQEFFRGARARRAMTGESLARSLVALVRRNRRRYGGYLVHAGVAVALVGVAGSTSFQHQRFATLRPGQSVHLDGYTFRYLHPTAHATPQKVSFGGDLAVTKGGHKVTTLHTTYGLYASQDPIHPIGRFLNTSDGAQTESRVGLDSGALRDLWVVISPNLGRLQSLVSTGDVTIAKALNSAEKLPPAQRAAQLNTIFQLRDVAINEIAQRFVTHPWASTFLIEVSPLVMWLWIGAIIAALGGLIALWPVPRRTRPGTLSVRRRRPATLPPASPAAEPEPERERELV
ncbi:MAG TPA: cytochrome c-type biogenesis CcmF C-terminal domain-containing protein [Solirubrobacteraceae bacterium]|jgi:cytochrome c-type biogenesis protein CcmF